MTRHVLRSLVLVCATLQILPSGWICCCGDRAACCLAPRSEGQAAGKRRCCCCQRESAPPTTDTAPQPAHQARLCCCHSESSDLPQKPDLNLLPPVVAFLALPAAVPPVDAHLRAGRPAAFVAPSPPLHVLQCVWLC